MPTSFRAAWAAASLAFALVVTGCGEPPHKEMHQAQGAIEAARAAGAADYAADELNAAVDAIGRAEAAVEQRDYRLALSSALDSRERAQNAAREAADGKARARSRAEGLLAELTAAVSGSTDRLKAAEAARVPKAALAAPAGELKTARSALQEAGAALGREDYRAAAAVLEGHAARLRHAVAGLDAAIAERQARQTRRRR